MRRAENAAGRMISEVHLKNFRGFKDFAVTKFSGINVIVGDNGAGKTALLEAIWLTLCASPQKAMMLRQLRGLDLTFAGTPPEIISSFYGDLFHGMNTTVPVEVELKGEGFENRSLKIFARPSNLVLPTGSTRIDQAQFVSPVQFEWTDNHGVARRAGTKMGPGGIEWETTGEEDRPTNFNFIFANAPVPAKEVADGFSAVRRRRKERPLVKAFTDAFWWIEDLSVESYGGTPILHATIRGTDSVLPLSIVSGAISRMAGAIVQAANNQDGALFVDEIENGIYFKNQAPLLKALVNASREYNCQLFLTTHSHEWLDALEEAAGDQFDDVVLYRLARGDDHRPELTRIGGRSFRAGLSSSGELR